MTSKGNSIPTDGSLLWTQSDESLMNAVTKRDISKIRSLMKKKVNPTKISPKIGIAAIHQAACYDKADIMKALMAFPLININKTDARKRAPVHHAAREGREECLEYLIQYQADTKLVENEGLTPLHLASMLGHLGCVQLLIPTLPSLEGKDTNGRTALYHAASRGSASICRLLLENGANVDATDTDGKSSIMTAAENGHQAAFQYLLANRANVKLRDKKGRDVYWYAGSQVDYLLGMPSPSRITTASRSSNDSRSHGNSIRETISSQPNHSSRWLPELDLTQADPLRKPKTQDSVSLTSTTESDDRRQPRRISASELKTNLQNTENQQRDRDIDRSTNEDLTKERAALEQKLDKLTAEKEELRVSTNEASQNLLNIRSNQQQIQILVKEAIQILTSSHRHPNSDDDEGEEESKFQNAVRKLSLTLKFIESCDRDELGGVAGLTSGEFVLKELQTESMFEFEIERLKRTITEQREVIMEQTFKLQHYEEKIRDYSEALREQAVVLKRFQNVKETVVKVTERDDVDDDHVADVIQAIANQCEKLHVTNQELEARCAAQQPSVEGEGGKYGPLVEQLEHWNVKTSDGGMKNKSESMTPISDLLKKQIVILRRSLENQISILVGRSDDVISPSQTTTADDVDVMDDVIVTSFERERQNRFCETVVESKRSVGDLARLTDGNGGALVSGLEAEGRSSSGISERTDQFPRGTSAASTNLEDSGFRTIFSDQDDDRGLLHSPDYTTDTLEDNRSLNKREFRSLKARVMPGGEQQNRSARTASSETQTTAWQNDSNENLIKQLMDQNSTLQTELSLLRKGSFKSRRENRGNEDMKKRKGDRNDFEQRNEKNSMSLHGVARFSHQVETGAVTESDSSSESPNSETVKHSSTRTRPVETITSINSSPAAGKFEDTKTKTKPLGSAEIDKSTLGKVAEKPPHPKHAVSSRPLNAGPKTINNSDHRSASTEQKSAGNANVTPPSTLTAANVDMAVVTSTHEAERLSEINFTALQNTRRDFHSDGMLDLSSSNRRNISVHRDFNSSDEETFEKIFESNNQGRQNRKNSMLELENKTKLRQAKRNSSRQDTESVSLENERFREELLRMKAEIKILQQRQHNSALPVAQGTIVSNALDASISRSFDANDQQMNSKNEAQDDNKSLDGYRFLSEDENGTLKFKEFPLTNSGQLEIINTPGTKDFKGESDSVTSLSSPSSDSASQAEDGEKTRKSSSGRRNSSKRQKKRQKKRKADEIKSATFVKEAKTRFANAPESLETSSGWNIYDQYQRLVEAQLKDESTTQKFPVVSRSQKSGITREKSTLERNVSIEDYQIQIVALRKQIREFERQHRIIIGIYRGHLLASIQGCLDSDVADALLRIVTLQDNRR